MNRTPADQSSIQFVYFDLGNVLVAFDPAIACANVARLFGVPADEVRRVIYDSGLQTSFEYGRVSGQQYAEIVRDRLAGRSDRKGIATEAILEAVSAMFTPVDPMSRLAEGVQASGLAIGVLSNTCVAHWEWILRQSYPALQLNYDQLILSFEVGSMKPDSAIYEAAERAAGVPPGNILFLDDRPENLDGARRRGWHAEHCWRGERAEDVLNRYGLLESGRSH